MQGTIQGTRIIPDKAVETNWGGQLTWKAEYRVTYSVAGREYTVWGDSGIRRESEAAVRLALPNRVLRAGYDTIRNDPKNLSQIADEPERGSVTGEKSSWEQ